MQATKKPSESHWCGQRRSPELQPHSGKPNLPQALACNCCWRKSQKKRLKSDQHDVLLQTFLLFSLLIAIFFVDFVWSLLVWDDLAAGLDGTSMIFAMAGRFCRTSSFSCQRYPLFPSERDISARSNNCSNLTGIKMYQDFSKNNILISIIWGHSFLYPQYLVIPEC